MSDYITTIGLEVHVQLKTRSKMFCSCPAEFGSPPNTHVCPVCLGLPGALPVMNAEAVRMTILTGLMLDCQINSFCKWDRKNYFYADMPKNYQISQYDLPLYLGGGVTLHDLAYPKDAQKSIETPDKIIALTRIHLEEDVGKSFHYDTTSGIDFNRAGTPLMEIVSEPDIASPEEAFAYLTALRQVLLYGGISDADMEKGQMRCDVNVSVRPPGQKEFNPKVEIKNLNSVSGVRRALKYEIERQREVFSSGGRTRQETRRWDDPSGETQVMRVKEEAQDYRYFPDPDLLPVLTGDIVAQVRPIVPETPVRKRARFISDFGLGSYDAGVLADDQDLAAWFERAAKSGRPKNVANWIMNDLLASLGSAGKSIAECPFPPEFIGDLTALVESGKINGKQAKDVFAAMFAEGKAPADIVKERGLEQVSDTGAIEKFCLDVIAANEKSANDVRSGNLKPLNFLKGQVMKLSKGQANPQLVGEVLERLLK